MKNLLLLLTLLLLAWIPTHSNIKELSASNSIVAKHSPKIVLITVDGAMWEDLYNAQEHLSRKMLPNIYEQFVDNGMAIGKTSGAFTENRARVSMPGYIEIISGHPSSTCFNNECNPNKNPTIINQFANDAVVIAGWETIAKTFDNSLAAVNVGNHIRSKRWIDNNFLDNIDAPDAFGDEEYRADKYTQKQAVIYLQTHHQPQFLWIGFGDTDEYAHRGDAAAYQSSLFAADAYIGEIMYLTDENTVYIVCPDHGRSSYDWRNHGDETSARVWILMAGAGIPKAGFVSYDHDVYLSDIVPTIMSLTHNVPSQRSLLNYRKWL